MKDLPDIHERVFIRDGGLEGVKRDFSKMFMKGETGVLILRPVEFLTKTAFKKRFPEHKKDLECMDPMRNVVNHEPVKKKDEYCVYSDNDPLPRSPIKFDTLPEAIDYVENHQDEEPFSIRYPGGQWHKWEEK